MKKYFGIFVVALAIGSSAFTVNHKSEKLTGSSFTYDLYGQPGQDNTSNLNNPDNYTLAGTGTLSCPIGTMHRCGVEGAFDDGSGHPDFTKPYTVRKRN